MRLRSLATYIPGVNDVSPLKNNTAEIKKNAGTHTRHTLDKRSGNDSGFDFRYSRRICTR